ncbi:regulatory protein RecX [Tersicoccus solisilvae]|uniref:Regulatory protein RecX n=1 Tax=Tersicoccus solisilvae TaxID=1882339 RepID=A0ABQ1PE21_9MICC|nr:regulatory protein RecX [Tersicoccus solisilvae]GGC95396.1 regulatory protein RecX [Tersicoccus solisilvae]
MARSIVLRQLTGSAKSRAQLEKKLADRDVPAEAAAAVLDRYEDLGLVDDAEFARTWVRSRVEYRHLGRSALRRELSLKGVDRDTVEDALADVTDDQEYAGALALLRRKVTAADRRDLAAPDGDRQRLVRRLVGMLARKGYPPGTAFRAVTEVLGDDGDGADPDAAELGV